MEFALLGPVEVRVDGTPLSLGGAKLRALLAMLLLARNEVVSRDRLIDGLWGDRPPPSADHSLDHYVSRLRQALGKERVERRAPGYVLHVFPGELDLDRFERLRRNGCGPLAEQDAAAVAETLGRALALWRGAALADVLYEPFAAVEAAQLEEQRLLVLEDRIAAELALGRARGLVPELERMVADHPFRERPLGQLMLALYRAGRQAEALEVYSSARRRLATELGLEPGLALRELERAILVHDLAPAPPAARDGRPRARASWRARHRVLLALVTLLAGLSAVAIVRDREHGSARGGAAIARGDSAVALGLPTGEIQRTVALPASPSAVAADGTSAWAGEPGRNDIVRIDAASGTIRDRIPFPSQPGAIVVDRSSVWVASTVGGLLARIDREKGDIAQTVHLGDATTTAMALGAGGLWVADATHRRLVDIDRVTGAVRRTISLGFAPAALMIDGASAWVANYDAATVEQLDVSSGQTVATVHVGDGPAALADGGGAVWVANSLDGTVSRINAATGAVTATVAVGSGPADVQVADGSVWVADTFSGTVARIDPTGGAVTRTVPIGGRPTALAVTPHAVWVGVEARGETHRGGALRLLTTNRFPAADPALYEEAEPPQFTGLAYDTLVTFTHEAGPAGLRLVPDLALALPTPGGGGTTYAFRLRHGIRYSDGRPVKAQDFRRAIERLFRVHSRGVEHYGEIVGARACARRPARCDLSRGVVTDDPAGTVVFHLSTPDPDFPYALTSFAFSAPVPSGTPDPRPGHSVVPATGPYRISAVSATEVRFVRNPFFREWSHVAQPDGKPDAIDWRTAPSHEAVVDAIEHGRADWTFDLIPPAQLRQLEARAPDQLHENPWFLVQFVHLNTTAPPFDDLRVRQALNDAIDRARVVRMYGGRVVATPTCQPLAPGIPGYVPYCPYTRHPATNGRWTTPDRARARRLVAESGRRGELIDVWGTTDELAIPTGLPGYVARVLRSLGFRTRLHLVPYASLTPAMRRHHQISVDGDWLPDYPAPSAYLPQFFSCGGAHSNGYFCDPQLDRLMARAQDWQLRNPDRAAALWTRIDHKLVDQAAWVPLVNLRGVDLVSHRLGNFTFHPVWGFIADQAWLR